MAKRMTRTFVARTLGSEPLWQVGDSVTFRFIYRNTNSEWELTLRREEDKYAPFKYGLRGRRLTFEGQPSAHLALWGNRYKTMEDAFIDILNHNNHNVNIPNRYKSVDQWFDELNDRAWI